MNFYPDQLRAIVAYLDALDAIGKAHAGECVPFPKAVPLTDGYGGDYGHLRDEIGGSWSWFSPEPKSPEAKS